MSDEQAESTNRGSDTERTIACIDLSRQLLRAIEEKRVQMDERGHRSSIPENWLTTLLLSYTTLDDVRAVTRAMEAGVKLDRFVRFKEELSASCSACGDEVAFETDGLVLRTVKPCECPEGLKCEFELNVPSGVMVVANDLRPEFDILGSFYLNRSIGCVKQSLAMAEIGCAHAFVSNTCPSVYRTGEDRFVIATPGRLDETGQLIEPEGELVASIITDLWWYSIVDEEEFRRRGCEETHVNYERVSVRPGVYRFTHHANEGNFDWDDASKPRVFANFEWVRAPDPVRDFMGEWNAQQRTVGQVIAWMIKRWPSLFGDGGSDSVQAVADHIFFVIGNGGDWHKNGFVIFDPEMPADFPEVEIPRLDQSYQWYPISDFSAIVLAARGEITLNASFLALARNVLECVVKHGVVPYRQEQNALDEAKQQVVKATALLAQLDRRYPVAGQ